MTETALFDAEPYTIPTAEPGEKLSAGRRLTLRQTRDLTLGRHPLTGGPLHPDAAPHDDRTAPGLRCGTCLFRAPGGQYPKCRWPDPNEYRVSKLPRVTHGAASDVRAWWGACTDWERIPDLPRGIVTIAVSEALR